MLVWQLLRQTKFLLESATWPTDDQNQDLVFGKVIISPGFDLSALLSEFRFPLCVITDAGSVSNPENPNYLTPQSIDVTIFVFQEADSYGEGSIIGAHRTTDSGQSINRGILELKPRVENALNRATQPQGVAWMLKRKSMATSSIVESARNVVFQTFKYEARIWDEATYPSPDSVTAVNVGGTVTVNWNDPYSRFDFNASVGADVRIIRKATTEPTDINDGTVIGDVAIGTEAITDTPGAGTWYYAPFSRYDEDGDGTPERENQNVVSAMAVV